MYREEDVQHAQTMYACPYYRGTGSCGGDASCASPNVMEPMCHTMAPAGGWENVINRRKVAWVALGRRY